MTEELHRLNNQIAEFMGWKPPTEYDSHWYSPEGDRCHSDEVDVYTDDLGMFPSVESRIEEVGIQQKYLEELAKQVKADTKKLEPNYERWEYNWLLTTAPVLARCKALCIALGYKDVI